MGGVCGRGDPGVVLLGRVAGGRGAGGFRADGRTERVVARVRRCPGRANPGHGRERDAGRAVVGPAGRQLERDGGGRRRGYGRGAVRLRPVRGADGAGRELGRGRGRGERLRCPERAPGAAVRPVGRAVPQPDAGLLGHPRAVHQHRPDRVRRRGYQPLPVRGERPHHQPRPERAGRPAVDRAGTGIRRLHPTNQRGRYCGPTCPGGSRPGPSRSAGSREVLSRGNPEQAGRQTLAFGLGAADTIGTPPVARLFGPSPLQQAAERLDRGSAVLGTYYGDGLLAAESVVTLNPGLPTKVPSRLFGHNEYVVVDSAHAAKVRQGLEAYYKQRAPRGATIKWVDNVPGGRNGYFDTVTGEIRLSTELLAPQYRHLAEGVLIEELQHFHQVQSRGWFGRKLTSTENMLLEKEVVQRIQRSGFKIFDSRCR